MATNGIQVPVSLYIENLQKIINELKGQLGNLKVGSSGFKALENHIRTLQKELDKFQVQASKPFTTENQFAAAEKSVNKLEDEIERISITASRLKFSDLELNGEQKAQLKAVEDQINAIKASLKAAKDEARKNFLSSDLGKQWIDLNPSEATRTLDQITNNIRKAVDDQNKQVQRAKETVDEYKRTITMGDIAQNVAKSTRGLKSDKSSAGLEALMGKEFSDFFTKRSNGDVAGFKAGQRGFFAEWLTKNFTIDPTIVKDLVSKTAPEIARVLNDAQSTIRQELNKAIANADTAKVNLPAANVAVSDAEAKVQALIPYLQQAMQATDGLKISEDSLREALAAAGITLENTKESIAANVRGSQEWSNVNQRATAELENLKNTLSQTNAQFLQQQRVTQNFNAMKMAVVNFMGFRQVLNLTKTAIREAINHIKELDSVMNKISIVTDMSTEDLWQQVDQYSKMAQAYGTTIKGAYEVSQIYYQQGLETNDVLTLTNETLKLAKVSGLDYAQTTDYMTTALRGFKMEMSEASKVVDVYSNLAAHTAVSSEELAVAMSKTASSMESVGSTFEETSAMIGTMVAVTRESATNIGSALKSIASRYGEMKQDPLKLVDSEGDEISYNKVDAALQSVGITMKTVDGQFRSFTDIIIELSEKWDQLESTQQRYIATQFAGNRQQSRFLALVSNPQLLKANLGYAEESEDTGTLQALKALDSIESKLNQVQVAYQQFYTTMGVENVWKGFLDGTKNVINTLNGLPKLFDKLPIGAIQIVYDIIHLAKSALISGLQSLASTISGAIKQSQEPIEQASEDGVKQGKNWMERVAEGMRSGIGGVRAAAQQAMIEAAREIEQKKVNSIEKLTTTANRVVTGAQQISADPTSTHADEVAAAEKMQMIAAQARSMGIAIPHLSGDLDTMGQTLMSNLNPALDQAKEKLKDVGSETLTFGQKIKAGTQGVKDFAKKSDKLSSQFGGIASGLNTLSMLFDTTTRGGQIASGGMMALSGAFRAAGAAAEYLKNGLNANVYIMAAMAIVSVINGIAMAIETPQEKLERLIQEAETLNNKSKEAKANYRTLDNSIKKLDELQEKRYESAEAAEEYQTAVDELAEKFPQMITGFNAAGEVIIDTTSAEELLAAARKKTAKATYEAAQGELNAAKQQKVIATSDIRKHAETLQRDLAEMAPDLRYELANIASKNIDFSTAEGQDYLKNIQELYKKAQNTYQNVDFSKLDGTFKSLISAIESQIDSISAIQGYQKATIGAWQQTLNGYEYIEKSSAAVALVTNTINKDFEEYSQSHNNQQFDINSTNYDYIVKQAGGHDPIESMNNFWSSLSEEEARLFEKMFSESNNYTVQDFTEVFSDKDNWLSIQQILNDYYLPGIQSMRTRLNALLAKSLGKQADEQGKYEEIVELDDKLSDFYSNFQELYGTSENQLVDDLTQTEAEFLSSVIKYHDQIRDNGYTNRAETFGNSALTLFNEIQNAPYDIEQQLWQLVTENSITTLEGINKIKDGMRNMGYDNAIVDKALDTLQNNIIPNINLEIQSATSNLLDTWEDTSKDLSKALSGGVTLKEADQLIARAKLLGLENFDLSQFQLAGDKLVLLSGSFDSYYEKLTEYITSSTTAWQGRIDQANKALFAISEYGQSSMPTEVLQDYKAALEAIGFTDWSNREYVTQWGTLTKEGKKHIQELIDNTTKELTEYSRATQIAARQLLTAHETSQGIYKLIIDKTEVNLSEELEKLKTIAKGGTIGGSELDEAAIKESINSVYDTFISDVLSKGFKNIKISDYEGLINKGNGIDLASYTSYEKFIKDYVDWTGKTTEEVNNLLLQAYEKDNAKYSEDLIKDFTFTDKTSFKATRDSLTKLANAYDKNIEELIRKSKLAFDETTQEYTISVEQLRDYGVDLSKIHNFEITVQESVDSLFSNLISDIQNALGGKLSAQGADNLQKTLKSLNISTELDYTRTAEGLKLTEDSFFTLYSNLVKINKAMAKKLLPDMANLSNKYKNINDVLDEFNKSLENTAKRQTLQDLLTNLFTEPENYKMLNYNLPSTWEMASNFYGSDKEAIDITKAIQTGSVGVEDFSKIVQAMINGGDAEVRKKGLDLLRQAPDYWKIDSKGNFVVDTKAWGLDKQYKEILDAYYKSTENFQKEAAKKQEEFNTLFFGSEYLQSADIWESNGDLNNDALRKLLTSNTDEGKIISQLLSQIQVENEDLAQLIKEGNDYSAYVPLIKQLAETNWEVGKTEEQWQSVLANAGVGGTITFDENGKSTVQLNTANTDIQFIYTYKGHEYTAEQYSALLQAQAQTNFSETVDETTGKVTGATYTINDQLVNINFTSDGTVTYSVDTHTEEYGIITASSEADLLLALRAVGQLSDDTTITSDQQTRTVTINGAKYQINSDGSVIIADGQGSDEIKQNLQDTVKKELEENPPQIDAPIAVDEITITPKTIKIDTSGAAITSTDESDQTKLTVQGIIGIIESYSDENSNKTTLLSALTAYINKYDDETSNKAELLKALTAIISLYDDSNAEKPTLEELTQIIKDIDTQGADAALEAWRAKQEEKALNISIQASNEPKRSYDTTKEFEEAVEKNTVLIESDGENFTFKVAVDAEVDFSTLIFPDGWQYNAENQTLTTNSTWYIPAELRLEETQNELEIEDIELGANTSEAETKIDNIEEEISETSTKPVDINDTGAQASIKDINTAAEKPVTKKVYVEQVSLGGSSDAAGNDKIAPVHLAKARGTLMGELGPEMYVTNGHYYIAGQNGAEMVDLPDDAIVFNHLQTRRLLDKGYGGRGKPVTNERKAGGEAHPNGRAPKDIVADFEKRIKDLNDDIAKIDQSIQDANQMYDKKVRNDVIKSLKTTRAEKVKDLNSLKNDRDYKKAKRTEEQEAIKEQKRIERNKQFEEDKKILREKYGEGTEEFNEAFKILEANHKKDIEAINKSSSNLSTAAKSENNAAKAQEQAAQAQQDAAQAQTEAAENLSNGITSTKNAWSSQQNPLGGLTSPNNLVHPNAAPKLKDLFGATTTNSSQSAGGKAGNTSKYIEGYGPGTGGTLTRNRSNMLNEYVKKASGGKSGADKELKEVKSAVSTFLNDLLTLGIESIDLSKYEKLPAALKSEIQAKLDNNESYRSFVLAYGSAMDKSMSEINETYFQAWQKDLEEVGLAEEQMTALEGLQFFKNGEISGTASDWTTLVGDKGFVGDAEEAGVLQWNAQLRTYVATSMEAVQQYLNTTLGHIFNFPEALIDSEAEINSQINELISKSISEGISAKEFKNLEEMLRKQGYDNKIDYVQTTQGKLMITKSSLESIGQAIGSSASTVIDSANSQLNDLVTLITQGFGSDQVINAEQVNNVKNILSSLDISVNDLFTQTENGFVTSFDQIYTLYSKLVLTNPEYAAKLLLNMSDEWLTSAEQKWKATELQALGKNKEAATVLDASLDRTKNIVELASKSFTDIISNTEYNNLINQLKASDIDSSKFDFTQTENGFITSFKTIQELYEQLILINPEQAAQLLLNMSDEQLTLAEQKWKAATLKAAGKNKEAAEVLDASIERANSITDLVSKSFTDFISNSEYNDLITKAQASGLDLSDINFIPTIEGYKLAFKDVVKIYMAQMDEIPEKVASAISSIDVTTLTNEEIAQYKDLIKAVEEQSTLRIKETNELYFKALEAERGETAKSAMKGLQYYASGSLGGSSSDWVNLLGDNVKISQLVEQGILAYNEALDTYVATDIASLQKLGLNGDIFDENIIKDSVRSLFNEILDTFGKAVKDGLSNVDVTKFKEQLSQQGINVDLTFEQALNGLKLTQESAISLYYQIKQIDSIQGELVFKELRASLEESNDKYKTMTSLIVNIVDLQEKIDQADKYNDAKVKQYKEELALAKEIAAVRATSEDSSFNFLDQDIPGAMNNPLNYVKNWSNAWNELREAATDDKSIDFQHFYNILGEINNLAKASGQTLDFMGTTLDGSLEAWDKAVNKSIDALGTDADKNYGVLLSKFGDNLSGGADAFASSADGAIHTMAKSQIKILDALIQMFEAIVAMEDFEGADLNLNDILDFEEVFQDTELEEQAEKLTDPIIKAATTLQEKFSTNGELRQAFEAVKVNGYSMAEIVEDAAGGVRKLNLNAQDYAAALSVLYEMSKRGDFDINNIAESLREQLTLNHSNFEGNIEYGDFIFNMHYNVQIKKNESGQYVTPSGKTFDNADEAIHVAALEELAVVGAGKVENITVQADHTAQGTLTIANTEITVDALASGIYYTVNGQQYNNLEAAEYAIWDSSNSGLEFGEWKLQQGLTVRMSIHEVKVENLTKDQIANAVGTTWDKIQAEWDAGVDQNGENLSFEAKYGISLDKNTTEADWERFKELAGVETKAVEVTANVQVTEGSQGLMLMLEKGSATLNIEAAIDETSKLFTDGDFTSNLVVNLENAQKALAEFNSIVNGTTATEKVNSDTTEGENAAKTLRDLINAMQATITVAINDKASNIIDSIQEKLDKLKDLTITIEATENTTSTSDGGSQAKGNVAMASGTRTLMGELGPELYVSDGRYHVAGENGAEFVNLPKDAIVFNHLQTQRLLSTGSTGRGRAVTSEANAVALAKGGPAAANAQKTLATLKQLRAMWSKLAEASIIDLAGAVNKESSGDKNKVGSWVADVEHWYNLLQKIARLEKEINYQEALRSKIEADRVPNGIEYYQSQVDSLKNLREQAATQKLLADSYDEYFEIRRKELNESPLSKFYEFNEAGQVQYKEGGLYQLASLFELDDTGKARYTPKQQYDILKSMGLGDYMLRDSNGLTIERDEENIDQFYYDSVQAAYERMTAEQQEMQDLYNNKEDAKVAYLEAITKADQLLQNIIDNQMDMEQKVLDAIETREQKIIDKMTKERQALADSSAKYFEGLEQALSKEREMYSRQQDQDSLAKLQRRLSILQRSGGSASEIASLQQEITDKQRDAYFEAQETAIQEVKDASDLQLEKMQEQIDLMTETLEYEKANGLLWGEVATILSGTSESIMEFITTNMPEWQEKSATAQNEELRTLRNSTQQWVAYYNNGEELVQEMMGGVQESVDGLALTEAKKWNEEILKSSPLQLNYPVLDTQVAEMQELYDNNNSSTQIDKLEYIFNVKEMIDAKEKERLISQAIMEGEEPWKYAFKRSPVNNSMSKGRYS